MANFVRGRLGDVGFPVAQPVGINPCGAITMVRRRSENTDISDSACGVGGVGITVGVAASRDQRMGRARGKRRRALGGHINIEGSVVLGHPLPDVFDRGLFRVREGRVVRIKAERPRGTVRAGQFLVPLRIRHIFSAEIQIQHVGRAGPAMKFQMLGEGAGRNGGFGCERRFRPGFFRFGCGRRLELANVENSAVRVRMEGVHILGGKVKAPQPLVGARPDLRR
ncbi:MAG: hypothetical protein BWX84_02382 [Verrucomicrobia bacterium ADurb.Bin118]|nr:MAG: hypothetical protein BWX84_02382 [Verrucomicrobia bacterium ADurb.Bin118]